MSFSLPFCNDSRSALNRTAWLAVCLAASLSLTTGPGFADNLPTGGQIVSGAGNISQSGKTMTVVQNTNKMTAHWDSFSIGQGHTVNFVQPSSSSVAFNRVLGNNVSVIQGALNANGQVFLINPNGVLFTPTAQVNVGGLVASTYNLSTEDFSTGRYTFSGSSSNAIINQGNIQAARGGTVAFIAADILNKGTIHTEKGNVLFGAGGQVTLDMGGPVKLQVDEGALNTLIEQRGVIRANGGQVLMTTKAAGELATSTINHTGLTEAQTLATGEKGQIVLLGDMEKGVTRVAGTLNASAPNGGDGGFIETSAATVDIAEGTTINAGAAHGRGGEWLIDPFDYTIDATAAGNIAGALNTGTSVTVTTVANTPNYGSTGGGNGDITVASDIHKTAGGDADLTLRAANTIVLNAEIKSTQGKLNVLLDADNDNGTRDGGGVIIANKGISTNGGNLDFGTGATLTLSGASTLVGGDVYVGGSNKVIFATGGGNINLHGELIIANEQGVNFTTSNGNASFYGIINSGNKYESIYQSADWTTARDLAKNGTAGGDAVGDSYLATVTSRLENAVVGYTANYQPSWLGGERVVGIGTDALWRWTQGPEGLEDGGKGLGFFTQNGSSTSNGIGGTSYQDRFSNWSTNEPNNYQAANLTVANETIIQIVNTRGQWNDLPATGSSMSLYIRETNFDTANLEVDAGTGTTYFAKSIGGLKGINFTSYDASNPKPVTAKPATSTPTTPGVPKSSAIAVTQGTASSTASGGGGTAQSQRSPGAQAPGGKNTPTLGNSGSSSGTSTAGGSGTESSAVGSMDIVNVSSQQLLPPSQGTGASQGDTATGNQNGSEDSSSFDFASIGSMSDPLGPTQVFVVDGGVRPPADLMAPEN